MEQHITHPDESCTTQRPNAEEVRADDWQDRLDHAIDKGVIGSYDDENDVIGLVMLGRL